MNFEGRIVSIRKLLTNSIALENASMHVEVLYPSMGAPALPTKSS
jgi:hypothetical protein